MINTKTKTARKLSIFCFLTIKNCAVCKNCFLNMVHFEIISKDSDSKVVKKLSVAKESFLFGILRNYVVASPLLISLNVHSIIVIHLGCFAVAMQFTKGVRSHDRSAVCFSN